MHITLDPIVLAPHVPVVDGGRVVLARDVDDLPNQVGVGTFSMFAIPITSVFLPEGDSGLKIMEVVSEALTTAGYTPVPAPEMLSGPVLSCRIVEMSFRNYTWTAPTTIVWGSTRIELSLTDPDGHLRWQREYDADYDGWGINESFDRAVNVSLGKILARAAEDFTNQEFRRACCEPESP